jgi:Zn-dependent protease with chaperone function
MSDIPADELPTPPRGVHQLPLPIDVAGADTRPPSVGSSSVRTSAVRPDATRRRPDGWTATLGPVDRVSFFEEQRRNRRATWRTSLACTAAVLIAGMPLSLVAAPILYPIVLVAAKLATFVLPIQGWIVHLVEVDLGRVVARIDAFMDARTAGVPAADLVLLGLLVVLPGILAMLCLWVALRVVFARCGVGAMLMSLGAREPRPGDLEERQLVNVVAEMALAAGLPPPGVLLLDSRIANAAAVGSCPEDAVVLVTRGVLDTLDRDETQGVLAHLIGSIGNGDLAIALRLVTVFRTFGLVSTLLDVPFSSSARATLWRFLTLLARPARGVGAEAEAVLQLVTDRISHGESEDVEAALASAGTRKAPSARGLGGLVTKIRAWVLFPAWMATWIARTMLGLLTTNLLSPLVALTWRTRRALADATAVQLTRYPDGLAQALLHVGGSIPRAEWASHLFVVGWPSTSRGGFTGDGSIVAFHPTREERLRRLRALGATVSAPTGGLAWYEFGLRSTLMTVFFFVPMMTLIAVLTVVGLGLLLVLLMFFLMFAMLPTALLYEILFGI